MTRSRFRSSLVAMAVLAAAATGPLAGATLAGVNDAIPYSAARHAVRLEPSILVPMRDGVRLSTDIYFPDGVPGRLPVILVRTQYNKRPYRDATSGAEGEARMFASQGFVVAVQDIRGRYESEGRYTLAAHDGVDGYDTIEWLSKQPWSNGRIGTYGCSSLGNTQLFAAQHRHPAHAAMVPQHAGGAARGQAWDVITNGVLEIGWAPEWFRTDGSKLFAAPPANATREQFLEFMRYLKPEPALPTVDFDPIIRSLPVIDMARKAGGPANDWEDYVTHAPSDPWWERFDYVSEKSRIDTPALFINSWYDMSPHETLRMFERFRRNAVSARARENQYAIIGPTGHCQQDEATSAYSYGARELGDARKDYWSVYLEWFRHWLVDDREPLGLPPLQYYLMGRNEWRQSSDWPLPGTRFTPYYLRSGGGANGRFGDGTLSLQPPGDEPPDRYTYDPATPVPSLGYNTPGGGVSHDQRDIEMRHDVLVYSTSPLEAGVEVTGPVKVALYVSSSARDTDFTAKLVDVYPDGRAFNIREGVARARYREGYGKAVWMREGEVYPIEVDLQVTGNFFGPGHRIRLEVSSSNFPRLERNLNTGGRNYDETHWVVARNSVHHSPVHASHLLLPVVPSAR